MASSLKIRASSVTIGLVLITFLCLKINTLNADDKNELVAEDWTCKKVVIGIIKRTIKLVTACIKEIRVDNTRKEFEKKMNCVLKCSMRKMKLLTPEGILNNKTVQDFMDFMIPKEAHDLGHFLTEDCLKNHGLVVPNNEEYCESYGTFVTEFAKCMEYMAGDLVDKVNCRVGKEDIGR